MLNNNVFFQKITIPPPWKGYFSKTNKKFKLSFKHFSKSFFFLTLQDPSAGNSKPFCGGRWIFYGTAQSVQRVPVVIRLEWSIFVHSKILSLFFCEVSQMAIECWQVQHCYIFIWNAIINKMEINQQALHDVTVFVQTITLEMQSSIKQKSINQHWHHSIWTIYSFSYKISGKLST